MTRTYAVSLGSLAMALVILRGIVRNEHAGDVTIEAVVVLMIFAVIGAMAGWIAEHLVCGDVEKMFRKRVDWYRQGVIEATALTDESQEN